MKTNITFAILVSLGTSAAVKAQNYTRDTLTQKPGIVKNTDDGNLQSSVFNNARPFPLTDPNPNEIRFYHRYWREMDIKDPKNQKFARPGSSLIETMLKGIKEGKVTAYDAAVTKDNPTGDAFVQPVTYNQLMTRLSDTAMVDKFDKDGNKIGSVKTLNDFAPESITGYRLKEDVYFDLKTSTVRTRIIGIAPLRRITVSNGDTLGTQPVCWVKFKEARNVFATVDESDADKNQYNISMDDLFMGRQFNAVIVEESNPEGLRIKDYKKDLASQAQEAQRIENKLAQYKKDMWNYGTTVGAYNNMEKIAARKNQKVNNVAVNSNINNLSKTPITIAAK